MMMMMMYLFIENMEKKVNIIDEEDNFNRTQGGESFRVVEFVGIEI